MLAVRPKIRINPNFTHYGLKLLIGGGSKELHTFGQIETGELNAKEPAQTAVRTFNPLEEVKG